MSTTNLSTDLSSTQPEHLGFQKVRGEKYCLKTIDMVRFMVYNNYISGESYENDGYEERTSIITKAKNKDILKFFEGYFELYHTSKYGSQKAESYNKVFEIYEEEIFLNGHYRCTEIFDYDLNLYQELSTILGRKALIMGTDDDIYLSLKCLDGEVIQYEGSITYDSDDDSYGTPYFGDCDAKDCAVELANICMEKSKYKAYSKDELQIEVYNRQFTYSMKYKDSVIVDLSDFQYAEDEEEYDDTVWIFDEDDLMNPDAGIMLQISEL